MQCSLRGLVVRRAPASLEQVRIKCGCRTVEFWDGYLNSDDCSSLQSCGGLPTFPLDPPVSEYNQPLSLFCRASQTICVPVTASVFQWSGA